MTTSPADPSVPATAVTATARPVDDTGLELRTAGETRSRTLRRRIAFALLTAYAVLMIVPFAWSVVTSFKTLPDSVQLTWIPDPFTLQAWEYVFTNLDPSIFRLFFNSGGIALATVTWNYGVRLIGVVVATLYLNLIPLATLATAMLLGIEPRPLQLVGGAIVLAGVVQAQLRLLKKHRLATAERKVA